MEPSSDETSSRDLRTELAVDSPMTMDPDWRTSRKHLYFIKGYLKPAPAPPVDLSEDFRESNEEIIRRLVRDGALEVCGLQDLVAGAFRKDELQDLVRRHGGALEGSKTQLYSTRA